MEIKGRFDHFNFNVLDLEKSIRFYEKALGLKEVRRKTAKDGSFILVYLGDGQTDFTLELTWLRDRKEPYDLGESEFHLCLRIPGDYDKIREFHREMGCISISPVKNHPSQVWLPSDTIPEAISASF